MHTVADAAENWPAAQLTHDADLVDPCAVPTLQPVHVDAPTPEYCPAAQFAQAEAPVLD